jgi:hypothetical protein
MHPGRLRVAALESSEEAWRNDPGDLGWNVSGQSASDWRLHVVGNLAGRKAPALAAVVSV